MSGIVIIAAFLYTLTIRGAVGNPAPSDFKGNLDQATKAFELSPERGRFTHVVALAEHNTYALNEELRDAAFPDVGFYDGKYFSFFAPGISYLSYPFYELGAPFALGQVAAFAFVAVISIITLLFLFRIARDILKFPLWVSLMAVITYAFASTAWSYAITLYQHHLTAFFILSSFYAVWRFERGGRLSFVWALFVWINYALAITIDYPNALLMLPVMVYLLVATVRTTLTSGTLALSVRFSAIVTMIAFVLISGFHAYHNFYYFGSPTQLSGTLVGYRTIVEQELSEEEDRDQLTAIADEKTVQSFFSEEHVPRGFYTLTVSDDRGLFFYTPLFLVGLVGLFFMVRRGITREEGFLLAIIGVNILLYSSWWDPWGGWAYGPRYLIPSMAVFSLLTWYGVWQFAKPVLARVFVLPLFVYSAAIALLGALTTNAVPPKVEGVHLEGKYNFLLNLDFMQRQESGSFFYNEILRGSITLETYFAMILIFLTLLTVVILFVIPFSEYDYNH